MCHNGYVAKLTKEKKMTKTLTVRKDADLEGVYACLCGCKYWENLKCADCGEKAPKTIPVGN